MMMRMVVVGQKSLAEEKWSSSLGYIHLRLAGNDGEREIIFQSGESVSKQQQQQQKQEQQ